MTLRHTGIVHMRKKKATGIASAAGQFVVTLPVLDAWGTHAREPWTLIWAGEEARTWWEREGSTLEAGDTIAVELEKARVHTLDSDRVRVNPRDRAAVPVEVHAFVLSAHLVKRAKNEMAAA